MVGDARAPEPATPETRRGGHHGIGVVAVLRRRKALGPGERAEGALARPQDVPGPRAVALDSQLEARAESDRPPVTTRVCDVVVAVDERPLGGNAPVVEDGLADQLELDLALEALDGPHEHVLGVVVRWRPRMRRDLVDVVGRAHRQRIAHHDPPGGCLPRGHQDVRSRLVDALRRMVDPVRTEPERTALAVEKAPEHARRIERRDAEPVDRTVGRDERAGMAVGEEGVVGDRRERRRRGRALGRRRGGLRRLARVTTSPMARASGRSRPSEPPQPPDPRSPSRRRGSVVGCRARAA